MARTIRCPNCQAPVKVASRQDLLTCEYCGHQAKQTVMVEPSPPSSPQPTTLPTPPLSVDPAQQQRVKRTLIGVLLGSLALPLILGMIVPVIVCNASRHQRQTRQLTRLGAVKREPEPDQLLAAKLGAHVECINLFSSQVRMSRGRYLSWVDAERGPDCTSRCVGWGIHEVSVPNQICQKSLNQMRGAAPSRLALDRDGDAMVAAALMVSKLTKAAHRYYNQKDYLDDRCAKGQAMHPGLMKAYDSFLAAEGRVRAVLDRELPALLARRAQRARAAGDDAGKVMAACYEMVLEARRLVGSCKQIEAGQRGDGDLATARAQLAKIEQLVNEAVAAEERLPRDQRSFSYFLWPYGFDDHVKRYALELVKSAKSFVRRHAGTSDETETLGNVISKYDDMVRWIKGAGPAFPRVIDDGHCSS